MEFKLKDEPEQKRHTTKDFFKPKPSLEKKSSYEILIEKKEHKKLMHQFD